jgi:hypothetical protein
MSGPWFSRVEREFEAGNLTRAQRDVLKALGRFTGCRFGIFPSHAFLAARVKCCVRTVQRALQAARDLGLVTWAAQRVRAGWRSLRASNRYVLTLPENAVGEGPHGPRATTGQKVRGVTEESKKAGHEGRGVGLAAMMEAARGLPDLLKARRETLEARWREVWEATAR